jgi:hypothetical protein
VEQHVRSRAYRAVSIGYGSMQACSSDCTLPAPHIPLFRYVIVIRCGVASSLVDIRRLSPSTQREYGLPEMDIDRELSKQLLCNIAVGARVLATHIPAVRAAPRRAGTRRLIVVSCTREGQPGINPHNVKNKSITAKVFPLLSTCSLAWHLGAWESLFIVQSHNRPLNVPSNRSSPSFGDG